MSYLQIENLKIGYGDNIVLHDIHLSVEKAK